MDGSGGDDTAADDDDDTADDDDDDDDAAEEAPRNSSQEESPVDSGSSSSSSSFSLDVSPLVSGGGKRDEYDCFGFVVPVPLSDELSDEEEKEVPNAPPVGLVLVLDCLLLDSFERSGEDEDFAEVVAAPDADADAASSCAL